MFYEIYDGTQYPEPARLSLHPGARFALGGRARVGDDATGGVQPPARPRGALRGNAADEGASTAGDAGRRMPRMARPPGAGRPCNPGGGGVASRRAARAVGRWSVVYAG